LLNRAKLGQKLIGQNNSTHAAQPSRCFYVTTLRAKNVESYWTEHRTWKQGICYAKCFCGCICHIKPS